MRLVWCLMVLTVIALMTDDVDAGIVKKKRRKVRKGLTEVGEEMMEVGEGKKLDVEVDEDTEKKKIVKRKKIRPEQQGRQSRKMGWTGGWLTEGSNHHSRAEHGYYPYYDGQGDLLALESTRFNVKQDGLFSTTPASFIGPVNNIGPANNIGSTRFIGPVNNVGPASSEHVESTNYIDSTGPKPYLSNQLTPSSNFEDKTLDVLQQQISSVFGGGDGGLTSLLAPAVVIGGLAFGLSAIFTNNLNLNATSNNGSQPFLFQLGRRKRDINEIEINEAINDISDLEIEVKDSVGLGEILGDVGQKLKNGLLLYTMMEGDEDCQRKIACFFGAEARRSGKMAVVQRVVEKVMPVQFKYFKQMFIGASRDERHNCNRLPCSKCLSV